MIGFSEAPSSVTIIIGNSVAIFRCRHQRSDVIIGWQINESPIGLHPEVMTGSIQDSNDTRIDTLSIPVIPEYNGTEVVCFAIFTDGSSNEMTPAAILTVIITGWQNYLISMYIIIVIMVHNE